MIHGRRVWNAMIAGAFVSLFPAAIFAQEATTTPKFKIVAPKPGATMNRPPSLSRIDVKVSPNQPIVYIGKSGAFQIQIQTVGVAANTPIDLVAQTSSPRVTEISPAKLVGGGAATLTVRSVLADVPGPQTVQVMATAGSVVGKSQPITFQLEDEPCGNGPSNVQIRVVDAAYEYMVNQKPGKAWVQVVVENKGGPLPASVDLKVHYIKGIQSGKGLLDGPVLPDKKLGMQVVKLRGGCGRLLLDTKFKAQSYVTPFDCQYKMKMSIGGLFQLVGISGDGKVTGLDADCSKVIQFPPEG